MYGIRVAAQVKSNKKGECAMRVSARRLYFMRCGKGKICGILSVLKQTRF